MNVLLLLFFSQKISNTSNEILFSFTRIIFLWSIFARNWNILRRINQMKYIITDRIACIISRKGFIFRSWLQERNVVLIVLELTNFKFYKTSTFTDGWAFCKTYTLLFLAKFSTGGGVILTRSAAWTIGYYSIYNSKISTALILFPSIASVRVFNL